MTQMERKTWTTLEETPTVTQPQQAAPPPPGIPVYQQPQQTQTFGEKCLLWFFGFLILALVGSVSFMIHPLIYSPDFKISAAYLEEQGYTDAAKNLEELSRACADRGKTPRSCALLFQNSVFAGVQKTAKTDVVASMAAGKQ